MSLDIVRFYFVAFTEYVTNMQIVHGVTSDVAARIAGVRTVAVFIKVKREQLVLYI